MLPNCQFARSQRKLRNRLKPLLRESLSRGKDQSRQGQPIPYTCRTLLLHLFAPKRTIVMSRARCRQLFVFSLLLSYVSFLHAQAAQQVREINAETRATRAFEEARKQGPVALRAFFYQMPKGADLHVHLSGAVYAESFIRAAGEDGLCVDTALLAFTRPPAAPDGNGPACKQGEEPAVNVPKEQKLYDALIDSFSMRTFVPKTAESGHDHFFNTFDKFGGTSKRHVSEWVDEVASRAAAQNEQYLELMETPDFKPAAGLAIEAGFHSNFAEYRFIYQVLRGLPKEVVFAQILLGFEMASADPRVVGLNLVQPEDCYVCMADYRLHMQMIDALHALYPKVHITLHAGELEPGMVPPQGLTFHIRSAVDQGHAERIGHGVDVMYEDKPYDLLKEMATKHVMVEVNLTSNDVILNIKGDNHPFMLYRKYNVPVALSTDDEGVSRIDLTHEYVRAAVTYPLTYRDFKQMARTGIEHSFLPGDSLWQSSTPEKLDQPAAQCRGQLGKDTPTGACATLVRSSEKAQQQWELEHRFHIFEAQF